MSRNLAEIEGFLLERERDLDDREQKMKEREESLENEKKEIEGSREELETCHRKIDEALGQHKNIVDLNVGGRGFTTIKENLMRIPGSYFYGMLSSDRYKPDEKTGAYFIDRNPEVFQRILDYLRRGEMDIRDLNEYQKDLLKDDLKYYSIDLPECLREFTDVYWDSSRIPGENIQFSDDGLTAESVPSPLAKPTRCFLFGYGKVDKFTVKILEMKNSSMSIGFWLPSIWKVFKKNKWAKTDFLLNSEGFLWSGDDFSGNRPVLNNSRHAFKAGDIVSVIRKGTTISFEINGVNPLGRFAFLNVPDHPLIPIIHMYEIGQKVTLIRQ
jgi:hypothetical protein